MKSLNKTLRYLTQIFALACVLCISNLALSASLSQVVDDFSHTDNNSLGYMRQFLSDALAGGKTTSKHSIKEGIIHVKGDIVPPRGQPGWASSVLLLGPQGLPQDASQYKGIKLKLKINKGMISVSANSTEVSNFDYHAATVVVAEDGQFHEVKIPFRSMKRVWSEQTQLNPQTLASISIVAFGLQKMSFDFALDEVSFY